MKKKIITISREFGSGGRSFAKEVAKQLGFAYYDKELIKKTAEKTGFDEKYIEDHGEYASGKTFLSYVAGIFGSTTRQLSAADFLYVMQRQVILDLAEQGNCVIVGRCADYILRDREGCLNIFIHADEPYKAERIVRLYGETEKSPEERLREQSRPLSSFSTRFDVSNAPRSHNIFLAASRIGGTVVPPGGVFSFNKTVGARTQENGFEKAAVIQDGQFVEGVGGGVCQASTTLFNAALLAGMKITESRAHSLRVSYVAPSLDAMVSEASDLKFVNPYPFPVYLLAKAEGGEVSFSLFGTPSGMRYVTESKTLLRVAPPPAKYVEGTEEKVLRAEQEGLASESYLLTYDEEGNLLSRERIRRDSYAAVQGIVQILPE